MLKNLLKPTNFKRKLFFLLVDSFIVFFATYFAYMLRFDFEIPAEYKDSLYISVFLLLLLKLSLFSRLKIYDMSWRHFGSRDMLSLLYGSSFATLFLVAIAYVLSGSHYTIPRSIIPIEFFVSLFLVMTLRVSKRLYLESLQHNVDGKPTLIIASLDSANDILKSINTPQSSFYPIAIVDEKSSGLKLNGIDVYTLAEFESQNLSCEVAIVEKKPNMTFLYDALQKLEIKDIKIVNKHSEYGAEIQNISLEDLLARNPQDLDKEKISSFVKNKVILVTGAGGSIGSEIVKQCITFGAKKLLLLDNSEFNLYKIEQEISSYNAVAILQSVTHKEEIENIFRQYEPQIVIHTAAYKHVPLVEENIGEAIVNNIVGTKNMIDISVKYEVEKFVLISTDKAVRPTNVMGTTKRICELYAQNIESKKTDIVSVRFGNVLGSSGSVIPKFQSQIEKGNTITVTHPDITRYFMLISEACELVLQAGAIGEGSEIFILDMGKPIKIVDLANKMIELSGKKDIKIEFSGLRKGEKLYEELLIDESDATTEYKSITVAKQTPYNITQLQNDIEELILSKNQLKVLKKIVPEFEHRINI